MSLEPKKLALLRILQILQEETDADHPLTQEQIRQKLEKNYGIELERKAIGENLSLLKEAGYEIESDRRRGSYLAGREFDDTEIRVLIDAVLNSRHISEKYSKDLIERLAKLASPYFRPAVKHIQTTQTRRKTDNKKIFLNIELINEAIEKGVQLSVDHFQYRFDKKTENLFTRTTSTVLSPHELILHNQQYYLTGIERVETSYGRTYETVHTIPLDRITKVHLLDGLAAARNMVDRGEATMSGCADSQPVFWSYSQQKPIRIELIMYDYHLNIFIDWFGKDCEFKKANERHKLRISLIENPESIMQWMMIHQEAQDIRIVSPKSLWDTYCKRLKTALEEDEYN